MVRDTLFRSLRTVIDGAIVPATILVREGRVAAIESYETTLPSGGSDVEGIDVGRSVLMAGLVDGHVHINEPGRTEWEGFVTATRAAATGGITTVVDMPLNCIPVTTSRDALETKAREAEGRCAVDYAFWGGVVPGNATELEPMIDAGVRGFKCFLVHSGIDDFPDVRESDLRVAMPILAKHDAVQLVHAEVPGPIEVAAEEQRRRPQDPRKYSTFLASRPRASEDEAIALMIRLARETGCRVHVVHLSSADALPMIERAKSDGVRITAETCPHYLTFAAEDVVDGDTRFKCCPPIRERENRERLWDGLARGVLDYVVSDHSPCTPALKLMEKGDFLEAWGGIAGLQFGLSSIWTSARARGFDVQTLARWMCERPALLAGLGARKGRISRGMDADFVVWSPDEKFTVTPESIRHRHPVTPYEGRELFGRVERTVLRGATIHLRDDRRRETADDAPTGTRV